MVLFLLVLPFLTPTQGFLNKVAANVDSAGFVFCKGSLSVYVMIKGLVN